MQQYALVAVTQLEQLTDLLGGYSHEVAERDHGPLGGRQRVHGLEQVLAQLGREQAGLGVAVEPGRGARPAAVGTERGRLDGRAVVALERGERDAAGVADGVGACAVDEDAEDPGAQGRAALEVVKSTDHGEPGLLNDLVGRRARAHERPRDASQRPVVPVDEGPEGSFVSGPQTFEKDAIVVHRVPNLPRGRRTGHGSRAALRCRS